MLCSNMTLAFGQMARSIWLTFHSGACGAGARTTSYSGVQATVLMWRNISAGSGSSVGW